MMEQILDQVTNNPVTSFSLALAQIISSSVVAIALFFTIKNYLKTHTTEQVKIAHDIFSQYEELLKEYGILREQGKVREKRKEWASRYCRLIEWFSFLVNTEQITNPRVIGFYEETITKAYDIVVPGYFGQDVDARFPGLSDLYKNMKEGKVLGPSSS
jgi:ABC-type bacteriocin/lantibiotic exporter with double-glycine peptidase domain